MCLRDRMIFVFTARDGEVASRRRVPTFGNGETNRTGEKRKQETRPIENRLQHRYHQRDLTYGANVKLSDVQRL